MANDEKEAMKMLKRLVEGVENISKIQSSPDSLITMTLAALIEDWKCFEGGRDRSTESNYQASKLDEISAKKRQLAEDYSLRATRASIANYAA